MYHALALAGFRGPIHLEAVMKSPALSLSAVAILFGASVLVAQAASEDGAILQQNFDSVPSGQYTSGMAFGENSASGVASSKFPTAVVREGDGVAGSSAYGIARGNPVVRSESALPVALPTEFRFFFRHAANEASNVGFVGAGWALEAGTDLSNLYEANEADRFLIGLASRKEPNEVAFAHMGMLSKETYIVPQASRYAALTPGNWYELSFELSHTGGPTWVVANLTLKDRGPDGVGDGEVLLEEPNLTIRAPYATNLNEATEAFAIFAANGARGADFIDNLSVTRKP